MVKSKPFTLRLTPETDAWVEHEARRTKRSKGAVVEALAEEAARLRRFPGIGFRGPDHDRRAWLRGTGLEVWEVIEGELSVTIAGETQVAGPGMVAIVPADTPHSVVALTDGRAIVIDYPLRPELPV